MGDTTPTSHLCRNGEALGPKQPRRKTEDCTTVYQAESRTAITLHYVIFRHFNAKGHKKNSAGSSAPLCCMRQQGGVFLRARPMRRSTTLGRMGKQNDGKGKRRNVKSDEKKLHSSPVNTPPLSRPKVNQGCTVSLWEC